MVGISEIWVVSFGPKWAPGIGWKPSFLTVRELSSRRNVTLDHVALFAASRPPYPTGEDALLVGFVGEAIVACHLSLGWPLPSHLVDLRVEFRNLANGQTKPCGDGLVGAVVWFGLHASEAICSRRTLVDGDRDVTALEQLFHAMCPELDLPRAILRGRYLVAAARIEATGIPIDVVKYSALKRHWRNIVRTMGTSVSDAKPSSLAIGRDGRHRAPLCPFASRTSRNQPGSAASLMAAPGWLRRLIKPDAGKGVAIVDWAQQEFGIAAALSGDQRMIADYRTGDPYLALAERYGGDTALLSRDTLRDAFKACALGVLNGIGASGLARQINCPASEARLLLQEHRASILASGVGLTMLKATHFCMADCSPFSAGAWLLLPIPIRAFRGIFRCRRTAPKCSGSHAALRRRTASRFALRTMTHC